MNKESSIKFITVFIGIIFLFPITVHAARPLFTDDAGPVGYNITELELGYFIDEDYYYQWIELFLNHGFSERLDLGFIFTYEVKPYRELDGLPDIIFKFALLEERNNVPAISSTIELNYPYFSNLLKFNLIVSKTLNPFMFHLNLDFLIGLRSGIDIRNFSFATEYNIIEKCNLVAEVYDILIDGVSSSYTKGLIGINYQIFDKLSLDIGVYRFLKEPYFTNYGWSTTFGLTINF
jgi:hypothetical protein